MRKAALLLITVLSVLFLACESKEPTVTTNPETTPTETTNPDDFNWSPDKFADKKIVRYQIPGWEKLSLQQKKLVYFLTEAGLSGRDIMYDQNYRHNLVIRQALDKIAKDYKGDRKSTDWNNFITYAKNVWFSNGIHHHYSMDKFTPEFSKDYFVSLTEAVGSSVSEEVLTAMFDPTVDNKKVNLAAGQDIVLSSAVNFYGPDVTQAEVEAYYKGLKKGKSKKNPISYGLNSKLVRNRAGGLSEQTYSANGLYGSSIKEIIKWIDKAAEVAENEAQGKALRLLSEYYATGDLKTWDEYNIAWVNATEGDIDYINSFIEVYNDPMGYSGSYESIVQIKDFDASERMAVVATGAQWFEDNSPILDQHKKAEVKGISYKVVTVAGESGDASPATPIGVNLPNADWIREMGSKSVSLGNIIAAYSNANGPGILQEFAHDEEEIRLSKEYGSIGDKMHTALHEVIGHASGKLEEGVGTPKETLKSYASALEEARADLVALYYIPDAKMNEMGLLEGDGAAKEEYDAYIRNGLLTQLRRIEPGKDIEESHMRNRQMISAWVYEKGKADNVIEMVKRDGKTYYDVKDYDKMRMLFGELLKEVQRIKSQGDYEAGAALIEDYGVKVDAAIHEEVLARAAKLDIPPYGGFINPRLVPVMDADGNITDVKVEYPDDFMGQMLEYGEKYSFLK
jgi:dipeptidyl-peptidase-3